MSDLKNEALIDSIILRSATDAGAEFGDPGLDIKRERAEALARMSPSWQDISAAPKDGTWVLVWPGNDATGDWDPRKSGPQTVAFYGEDEEWHYAYWDGAWDWSKIEPTHWMPLPAPPTTPEPPQ